MGIKGAPKAISPANWRVEELLPVVLRTYQKFTKPVIPIRIALIKVNHQHTTSLTSFRRANNVLSIFQLSK
jgi:hypothetical protein